MIKIDDIVEGIGDLPGDAGMLDWHSLRKIAFFDRHQNFEKLPGVKLILCIAGRQTCGHDVTLLTIRLSGMAQSRWELWVSRFGGRAGIEKKGFGIIVLLERWSST
ncbi:MAG TPA: hypothetical protein VFU22_10480 [Roseiflexaceae bacterium]|nr:hypothetical protein [Roseiflexaceae bacterium]